MMLLTIRGIFHWVMSAFLSSHQVFGTFKISDICGSCDILLLDTSFSYVSRNT